MAQTPSNINQLTEEIKASGLAYTNRYEVAIYPPAVMNVSKLDEIRSMSLRCDSVTIPGRALSTVPFRIYGPARNIPYEQIYSGEINLSFMVSEDLRERNFFEIWMAGISNLSNYKMQFYDDYVSTMEIDVLSRDNDESRFTFTIEEVYPKAIGDLQVAYDKDNEFLRQDITMSFRKYSAAMKPQKKPPAEPENKIASLLGTDKGALPDLPSTDTRAPAIKEANKLWKSRFGVNTVGLGGAANSSDGTVEGGG